MLVLDDTDVLEGGASVDAVVDYTFHGLVGSVLTQLAAGTLSDTLTAVLYTAADIVIVTAITLVNTHSAVVNITLRLDPADGGNPRYIIPKTVSLGIGYSLHTDGVKIVVVDATGGIVAGTNVSDTAYAASWDGVTNIAPSKNAVYDQMILKAPLISPSFTTPDLDTPSAGVLTNCTGLPATSGIVAGAADLKLFTNAAGDAPEWASGVYVGTFTRDMTAASGDVEYSSVPFKSSAIFFLAALDNNSASQGFDDGTTHKAVVQSVSAQYNAGNFCIYIVDTTGAKAQTALVKTMDADGFTLTWAKSSDPTGTLTATYIAFR